MFYESKSSIAYQDYWSLNQTEQPTNFLPVAKSIFVSTQDPPEFTLDSLWNLLSKTRFLFYLIWPTETMFPALDQVPRYVAEMFPIFFILAIFENGVRILQGRHSIKVNETIGSLSQGIFQECLRIKIRSIEVLMYCLFWDNFRLVTLSWNSLWTWWICYIAVDFGFYWAHRLAHEVNFIWAIHQAHHSSEEFSIVSALRQAVLQPFTAWFTYIPIALFVPPQIFLAHLQLSELYMAWLHTEVIDNLGPLEYIFNTPSHHRVHHSRLPQYIDKNYGGMLIIWDRMFNTFKSEDKTIPSVYGIVEPVRSFNPFVIQFHTWPVLWRRLKHTKGVEQKFKVIFYGPSWKPNQSLIDNQNNKHSQKVLKPAFCQYDPQIAQWKKIYIIIHFAIVLFFYHELTINQRQFSPMILNTGVLTLLSSITTLSLMLDDRYRFNSLYELIRCVIFFKFRYLIIPIIDHGLETVGFGLNSHKTTIILVVNILFALSILANTLSVAFEITYNRYIYKDSIGFFLNRYVSYKYK